MTAKKQQQLQNQTTATATTWGATTKTKQIQGSFDSRIALAQDDVRGWRNV